ncbi:MAG TPA: MBL fold metallo-hydrolase [Vicinamibacterales bacterium]|jgi:glyoxylase-like metal-dependent hydrolase (beta-lactamase superfamily II)
MILKQFYLGCLAHASYLIGDDTTREAAVVDPQRDVDRYLEFAAEQRLQIRHVILTHLHADFVAGHIELRDRVAARIYLGDTARAEYAFVPLGDGDRIELGDLRLQALVTPGHTPESISLLVFDRRSSDREPYAVLTGDTLFAGDVGRPDLRAALGWSANELGGMLYDSLTAKLLALPDSTLVYPAHGAGSLCGKAIRKETISTIGQERSTNYALQPMSKAAFVQLVTADQPEAPDYFTYDAVLNSRERPTLDAALAGEMNPLTLDDVLAHQRAGAQLVDTRDPEAFAPVHLAGGINIGLNGQFATWAGTILDRDSPLVIVADPGREREAATRLGRIGFDRMAGFLSGGMQSVGSRHQQMASVQRISPALAADFLTTDELVAVDVRSARERAQKSIPRSLNVPLNHLVEKLSMLPGNRPLLVHCAGGYRSSIAASLLQRAGFRNVADLAGGIAAWETSGLPLARA